VAEDAERQAARSYPGNLQFLVFELQGQRYGVDVAEVEAIVQATGLEPREGGFAYQEEGLRGVHPLSRWVGLPAAQDLPATPHHLLLSRSAEGLNGLLVDMPRDIVSLPLEDIYALPPLIRHLLPDSPLWGVGRAEDGLILLVDPVGRHYPDHNRVIESEAEL
jgi:chemotaxis signal transduction protein